jgi:hypothetical protein
MRRKWGGWSSFQGSERSNGVVGALSTAQSAISLALDEVIGDSLEYQESTLCCIHSFLP